MVATTRKASSDTVSLIVNQRHERAQRLERAAFDELVLGHHALAERLSWLADDLRAEAAL